MQPTSFITPIKAWEPVGNLTEEKKAYGRNGEAALFSDVFKNVIEQVHTTQEDVENKQYLLSTGQLDDAHTLPIAEAKAELSLDILITLRNKAVESYNELMKMNV
ncbi:MAG: flagellar hook-basal body complex protein FliE [Lachnospiraceae bacterium]